MMVEVDSPSYSSLALSVGYCVFDLTDDPELKRLADHFLTLWWALWAEQQSTACAVVRRRAVTRFGDER